MTDEERREMVRKNYAMQMNMLGYHADGNKKDMVEVVRCKDCDNKECWGRAGDVVCGIDGTPHRPDWFCADGRRRDE